MAWATINQNARMLYWYIPEKCRPYNKYYHIVVLSYRTFLYQLSHLNFMALAVRHDYPHFTYKNDQKGK